MIKGWNSGFFSIIGAVAKVSTFFNKYVDIILSDSDVHNWDKAKMLVFNVL